MSIKRVTSRYAKSLLDLSVEKGQLEAVLEDMKTLGAMVQNRDLALLLKSPIVNTEKKRSIFKIIFDPKFSEITKAFIHLVLNKGREALLPEIGIEFINQHKEMLGITSVKITTATPITKANIDAIKLKLLGSSLAEKSLDVETEVDPDIIGGFVLEVGDNLYDNSIAYRLKKYEKKLKGSI
jgi:F-type H+-transporting ATPase subunit delta